MRRSLPDINAKGARSDEKGIRSAPVNVSLEIAAEDSRPSTMPNSLGPMKGISPLNVKQRLASPAWQLNRTGHLLASAQTKGGISSPHAALISVETPNTWREEVETGIAET